MHVYGKSFLAVLTVVKTFVFFMQKTAYEMRISDWSSDVCSSDLRHARGRGDARPVRGRRRQGFRAPARGRRAGAVGTDGSPGAGAQSRLPLAHRARPAVAADQARQQPRWPHCDGQRRFEMERSEEHKSALQTLMRISSAVFCSTYKT